MLDNIIKSPLFRFLAYAVVCLVLLFLILRLATQTFPPLPDIAAYESATARKNAFFNYLKPIIEFQNLRILSSRARLQRIHEELLAGESITWTDERWLYNLADEYGIDGNVHSQKDLTAELILRVDVVPVSLALIQAAKESGWGRSRYAEEGNNLFGQWCYLPGCGIVPTQRSEGATHEVRSFDTVSDAVFAYMRNLNTHQSYGALRAQRADIRAAGRIARGAELAESLIFYSERREAYVEEVKAMIRQYLSAQSQQRD